jgi:rhomboid family GlyGly-CTERM serine protease
VRNAIRSLLSHAEVVALLGACVIAALQAMPAVAAALAYQRDLLGTEPWRLVTAHLVHINWTHALINAATWWVLARLFAPDLSAWRQLITLGTSALFISLGLALLYPEMRWYRGASASLHALFFCGAVTWLLTTWLPTDSAREHTRTFQALWLPTLLVVGGMVKIVMEHPRGNALPYAEWLGANTAPQAHTLGAIAGVLMGCFYAWRTVRRDARRN